MITNDFNQDLILNKKNVLAKTDNGYRIYQYIFDKFGKEFKINSNIKNPFYDDKNPSLSINYEKGILLHKDFGNDEYSGDCFNFAGNYYSLDPNIQFPELLMKINNDLNLSLIKNDKTNCLNDLDINFKGFGICDMIFWNEYGISEEILSKFNVKSIDNFRINTDYKTMIIRSENLNPIFGFIINFDAVKIYQPLNTKYKFSWRGNKPEDYIFGLNQIDESKDLLIITGGEKDVMVLHSIGYNAVCLNSETCELNDEVFKLLKEKSNNIVIMYDIDSTGDKMSRKIAQNYNLPIIHLPQILFTEKKSKDISDYIKLSLKNCDHPEINVNYLKMLIDYSIYESEAYKNKLPQNFPFSVYNSKLGILYKLTRIFETPSERDAVLLASITTLSALLPGLHTTYDKKNIYSNLYFFALGLPASGKGSIQWAQQFVLPIDKVFRDDKSKDTFFKQLLIPASSSIIAFVEVLDNNDGLGIMFATESDTLKQNLKNEWGDFSDILRSAFHHEIISINRKTEKIQLLIQEPKLSIVLSGTPNQFVGLMQNPENGLFSRFIYYRMNDFSCFRNVFEEEGETEKLIEEIHNFSKELFNYFSENKIKFSLTPEQKNTITKFFEFKYNYSTSIYEQTYIPSSIKRMQLIFVRITMVLSALEQFEDLKSNGKDTIYCSDFVFQTTLTMINVLFNHLEHAYFLLNENTFKSAKNVPVSITNKQKFYNDINDNFRKEDALRLSTKMNLSESTCNLYLKDRKLFKRIKQGRYAKLITL